MICPFMSRPMWDQEAGSFFHEVDCYQQECKAWDKTKGGFCKLIDGQK